MRVLFVNPFAGLGGSERSLLDILASLRAAVPEVEPKLLLLDDGELAERARGIGVDVEVLELPAALAAMGESSVSPRSLVERAPAIGRAALGAVSYLARLRHRARAFAPHVIHTNGMKAHVLMALATPATPRVVNLRDFASARPLTRHLLPLVARRSLVVTNSIAVETDARSLVPNLRTRVVYNGIDLEEFRPAPRDDTHLATLAGMSAPAPDTCVTGLVATYAWWKGHATFLRAAARVRDDATGREHRFYIVGGPIYGRGGSEISRAELERQIRELGLDGSVGLVPFQSDAARVYRGLDVVVHASDRPEPFGRTIVEGMASGRPVVVARAGGAAELFTEGRSGLGHEPGDARDLARAVLALSSDPTLRARLGENARSEAEARFDRRRLGAEFHAAYGELLGERVG
jgi:glycosyltransferase involved in cell wall biosynthesis